LLTTIKKHRTTVSDARAGGTLYEKNRKHAVLLPAKNVATNIERILV
jgi:hypothetical protein